MDGGGVQPGPKRNTELLLTVSESFLKDRLFDSCRRYALRAQSTDPTNPAAARLLAVADVLSSAASPLPNNTPNWYSILGLENQSSQHLTNLVKARVDDLTLLLNPSVNKNPLAIEAFELVRKAWAVLSDPVKKARFDIELGASEPDGGSKIKTEDTFWTLCPHCYYVYEYPRVYEECCLRCHNGSCGKGFQAVAIRAPRPPPAVVEKGEYLCRGFVPVGFEEGGSGCSSWTPFGPVPNGDGEQELEEEKTNVRKGNNNWFKNMESFVEISDDSDDELMGESSFEKVQREGSKDGDGITDGCGPNSHKTGVAGALKPVLRRKKMVAKNTKKVMGRGIRVKLQRDVAGSPEGVEMSFRSGENDGDLGCGIGVAGGGMELGSWSDSEMGEIQFFEGLDDVFVGLQDGF